MMTSKAERASFSRSANALLAIPYSVTPGESRNFDLNTSSYDVSSGSNQDPPYLFSQIRSSEWLERYGLKSQKLTFDQILQQIGFKRVETFDPVIGKTVKAKYAGNLYHEVLHDNGDRYVLTCRPEKLREFHQRLHRMLNLLRKRVLFITTGSRRLFGVISEQSVCLVCDCKTVDHRIFNQFQTSLTALFKEQISKVKKFNIVWVSNDNEQFREQLVDVNATSIDHAIDWICDKKCPKNKISISATCEAVLKAYTHSVQSIYLISEGDSSDTAREMLRDNVVKTRLSSSTSIPFHVISLFCHNNDTEAFLRSLAQSADGSYFSYKLKSEFPDFKAPSNLMDPTRIKLQGDKFQMGTNILTSMTEFPTDIKLMYKESIECQNVIDRLEKILGFIRDESQTPPKSIDATKSIDAFNAYGDNSYQRSLVIQSSALFSNEETDISSADWLKIHGIDAQKLDFFSVLHAAAFRHCDGVVTLLKPPGNSFDIKDNTPANPQDKLVNAIYCDQFAHVTWPDATIRHVHVTPELYRDYEKRMRTVLEKIRARLTWLKKGSRDVFGAVLENNIYILIDTSQSMQHHLNFVKEKLRVLIQDQLFAKERLNVVAFNSMIMPWRDRLTKISDTTTYSQLQPWIDGLHAEGSTNTLAALRFALADPTTEAIYLLTDGRPDQNERHILSQVQYRQTIPIHTIAFNCNDQAANQFLIDLAKQTGGRFHTFNYGFDKPTAVEIPESEDVGSLKQELMRGEQELQRIAALRDECLGRAWSRENLEKKMPKSRSQPNIHDGKPVPAQRRIQSALDMSCRPQSASMPLAANKKKRPKANKNRQRRCKSASNTSGAVIGYRSDQWLLRETKEYLNIQNVTEETKSDTETRNAVPAQPPRPETPQTPYKEVLIYLKKNSVAAKSLTILDVLYPSSVTVRDPCHIQLPNLDKYVLAKVWDDILPLCYVSSVNKFRLVNHYAVNFDKYEAQLQKTIDNYYEFVTKFIWKHLSDDEKRKLVQHLHWNALPTEEQNQVTKEISEYGYTSQTALENFAWRKLTDEQQRDLLMKPIRYIGKDQDSLKDALSAAENESALKGVKRMDVEIHRAIRFLQIATDLRQLQRKANLDAQSKSDKKPPVVKRRSSVDRNYHQRVICRFDADGFFRPGTIQKHFDGHVIVRFDIGLEQEAIGHILLPTNGAIAQPHLCENDCVLVRQTVQSEEYWVPGIIRVLPSPVGQSPRLYMIQVYSPRLTEVNVCRRDILKISLALYQRTTAYILNIHRRPKTTGTGPKPPPDVSLEGAVRKGLKPVEDEIEILRRSHKEQYEHLEMVIASLSSTIRTLQEKAPPKTVRFEGTQTAEISVKTYRPEPDPPERIVLPEREREEYIPEVPKPADFIERNTKVYALWREDDCYFHKGIVLDKQSDSNSYIVERVDLPGVHSVIPRNNIFLRSACKRLGTLPVQSFALIEYPKNKCGCWKPAVILDVDRRDNKSHVRFYDCIDDDLPKDEFVIEINEKQFSKFAQCRIDFESSLINKVIVGLNEKKKIFMLGTVIQRISNGHEYMIEWCDGKQSSQQEEFLYGAFTRPVRHELHQIVLAVDDDECNFKLAEIVGISDDRKTLTVRFLDSEDTDGEINIKAATAFFVTEAKHRLIKEKINA